MDVKLSDFFVLTITFLVLCISSTISGVKEPPEYWHEINRKELEAALRRIPNVRRAKNVIFCLGDGMGLSTIVAMRHYKNELAGRIGDMNELFFEKFPHTGLLKAYTTTQTIADSAATATAYMTGFRTKTYMVNVDDNAEWNDCAGYDEKFGHKPVTRLAKEAGKSVGMVTTSRVTHATPATSYANAVNRWWEADYKMPPEYRDKCPDIARQFVEKGDHLDVMMAGGRSRFLPTNETDPEHTGKFGKRLDGRNLIKEWEKLREKDGLNCSFVYEKSKFDRIDPSKTDCVLGLFEDGHMRYEADRLHDIAGEPSLTEMTEKAIKILQKNKNGFFLFLEGARIDHAHHGGRAKYAITDGIEFDRAIQKAVEMTNAEETLVIVTADHSHSMHIVGYKSRNTPLFGFSDVIGKDGMPYTTIIYSVGPGYNHSYPNGRQNLTLVDTDSLDYRQQSAVPTHGVNHAGEDLTVYAQGPWSHLIYKLTEQTYINEVMQFAACFGRHQNAEHCKDGLKQERVTSGSGKSFSTFIFLIVILSWL